MCVRARRHQQRRILLCPSWTVEESYRNGFDLRGPSGAILTSHNLRIDERSPYYTRANSLKEDEYLSLYRSEGLHERIDDVLSIDDFDGLMLTSLRCVLDEMAVIDR